MAKPFLNVGEVATIMRVSKTSVYEAIRQGVIPAIRVGPRTTRIPSHKLLNMVSDAESFPEPQAKASKETAPTGNGKLVKNTRRVKKRVPPRPRIA